MTFSAAKGLPYDWCLTPDLGLPRPDVVLFLNISEEDSSQRAGFGEERYEKKEIQDKVRRLFERMYKDRNGHKEDWELVDAGRTLEEVSEDMWRVVKRVVEKTKVGGGEVGVTY